MLRGVLFVRDNETGEVRKFRPPAPGYQWTPDSRRILYTRDQSGAENAHVYMIDTDGPAAAEIDLTPYPGVRAAIHSTTGSGGRYLLVYHNRRDRSQFDLYRIDLETREEMLVARNPGDGVAALVERDGTFKGWTRRSAAKPAQPLATRRPALLKKPDETFRVLGASKDPAAVWALSDRGRDRVALVMAHPTLGWEKVIFEDPHVDVTNVIMSAVTRAPLAAIAQPGYPRVEILDSKLRDDLDGLLKAQGPGPYGVEFVTSDDAEQRLIVAIYTSTQRRHFLVDRRSRTHTLLTEAVSADVAQALAPMQPVAITSRDGLTLNGYLTLPRGVEPKRLPMVLLVHGGPWMRNGWSDPAGSEDVARAQFLANRGYAVLQVDFRGSTGYGRRFVKAGMGEFAGGMHDDLLDAVRWAVDGGIADPSRVGIMGYSYGGYAALVGLTLTPDVFACGVSLGGPTDLATLIESFPPYWAADLSMWHDYVGDPRDPHDREQMMRKSPLAHAGELRKPVLIIHGAQDVRVRIDQAQRMVDALRQAGKPVEYLPIADMGHGMGWWVHRLAILRQTEDFFQRCLGGRASRFDPFDAIAWAWSRISR